MEDQHEVDLTAGALNGAVHLHVSLPGEPETNACFTLSPERAEHLAKTLRRFARVAREQLRDECERN